MDNSKRTRLDMSDNDFQKRFKMDLESDITDALGNYGYKPLRNNNDKCENNNDSNVVMSLINKNLSLTERLTELNLTNKFLEEKLSKMETDQHLKDVSSSGLINENQDLKNQVNTIQVKNSDIKSSNSNYKNIIFWQKYFIILQTLIISFLLINSNILNYFSI